MSSFFPHFNNLFRVGKTISQNSNTDPNDVLKTKNALVQTGDYQIPDYGITDIPDMGMINGLKRFQQKNGLKIDGIMNPGGPTESKIGETLANQEKSSVPPSEDTCINQKIDFWIAEEEYQNAREAMRTVENAIEDIKREKDDMKNYSLTYPHPDCQDGKIHLELPLELENSTETSQREGIQFEFNLLKSRWKWVQVIACSADKNGEEIFDNMKAIKGLEEHLGELESVKTNLDNELRLLKQASDNTLDIYKRCRKEKGKD